MTVGVVGIVIPLVFCFSGSLLEEWVDPDLDFVPRLPDRPRVCLDWPAESADLLRNVLKELARCKPLVLPAVWPLGTSDSLCLLAIDCDLVYDHVSQV